MCGYGIDGFEDVLGENERRKKCGGQKAELIARVLMIGKLTISLSLNQRQQK